MKKEYCFGWMIILVVIIFFLIIPLSAFADDKADTTDTQTIEEMVVTDTRTETPMAETTKSVDVIYASDREEQQQYFLPELIDNQPGVYLKRNGGIGQFSTISIRGSGAQDVQYQYNGLPLRDAADTQSTMQYFIEDMYGSSNLERVEILKGTNSTLYGSQAMGGVINIMPRKWHAEPVVEWRSEIGPDSTYIGNALLAYGQEKYYVDFNPIYVTTDGEDYGGEDSYEYDSKGFTLGAGFKPTDQTALEFSTLFSDNDLVLSANSPSLDADGNLIKNQASSEKHRESLLYQLGLAWSHAVTNAYNYTLKGSYGATERHYFWSQTDGDQSNYDGNTTYLEMQHNLDAAEWLTLTVGADYEEAVYDGREPRNKYAGDYSAVDYDESWGSWDAFAQAQTNFLQRSLFFTLGGRYNNHEEFDDQAVWEASGAYILQATDTKFHAHVGSGYRTPSLYEIYGGYLSNGTLITIGNPDLTSEESFGYEFGVDQPVFNGRVSIGATYFITEYDDRIIYDGTLNRYENASEAEASGVEAYLRLTPWQMLKVDLAYTYVDSKYKADKTATQWTRKEYLPRNTFDLLVTFTPVEPLTLTCDVSWQDEKVVKLNDPSYTTVRWEEDAVTTVDLAASYKLLKFMDVFARVENLFDEDYTESGYCMPGMTVYGGVKLHL
ncbi:BtuB1: vitamin B12 transporter, cobalamin receptor [Desulfosarcina variabilis str. Montpellier]|uniref:TonB-dependent receptor plug domain-containing protein n=1 Tax=Desulfosarcina variabilis TaxID=2300 RepID=UPI003AFB6162